MPHHDRTRAERLDAGRQRAAAYLTEHARTKTEHHPPLGAWAAQHGHPWPEQRIDALLDTIVLSLSPSRATRHASGKARAGRARADEVTAQRRETERLYRQALERGEVVTLTSRVPLNLNLEADRAYLRVIAKRRRAARRRAQAAA